MIAVIVLICAAEGIIFPNDRARSCIAGEPRASARADPRQTKLPATRFIILEGQVTDHIGAGRAGVTVAVRRKTKDARPGDLITTTETNKLGDFTVTVDEPVHGDIVVALSKPGYVDVVRQVHLGEQENPPFLAETLEGNLTVAGLVTDALSGKPVTRASVKLRSSYKDWDATTDDKGRFTIRSVAPGAGELIVEAVGYGREQRAVERLEDPGELVLKIKPERILHLEIVDELDRPIPGVSMEVYDQPHDDFRNIVTDKRGSATIRGIHFDTARLTVRLAHADYVSSEGFDRTISTPDEQTESTHRFVMTRGGRVTGTITDRRTGDPLHGARVFAGTTYSDSSPRDWSDYEGEYTVSGVKPGSTTVTVHLSGYAPALATVEVKVGETTPLDLQLGPPAVLRGVVKSENGKPVTGAHVEATRWRGSSTLGLRAITDHDGKFLIEDAPHDEFQITVSALRRGPVTRVVKANLAETVEIMLPDGAAVRLAGNLTVGSVVPAVAMKTLDGKSIALGELRGKTILLDFWATWCGPCIEEIPDLKRTHDEFGSRKDFLMIAISLDWDEKALRKSVDEHKMTWPQVVGDAAGAQRAADSFGVKGLPAVFLVGPDGKIAATDLRGANIRKRVEQLLKAGEKK